MLIEIRCGRERALSSAATKKHAWALAAFAVVALLDHPGALAATGERTGKEVVESACIACHSTGVNGAPKIGDAKAWSKRASQGLTSLTENALKGIRQMPAHGGNPGLTDFEIERAITYMVNQSGGHWNEPISKAGSPPERTGEQIVRVQCAKCHETGAGGAPKIGDRAAWIPRMKQGFDIVVRSAINGHGGMPARGGMADLTDPEIRNAVVYMFNAGTTPPKAAAAASPSEDYKIVDGMTVYLGVVPASVIRAHPNDYPPNISGATPSGAEQRYVTIALFDAKNGQRITDAAVTARVAAATEASAEKTLQAVSVAGSLTYGGYFPMAGGSAHKVTVHIHRPGSPSVAQAEFQYKSQ
jgi:cytochrome c5